MLSQTNKSTSGIPHPTQEPGAFVCRAGQRAKRPDSLEHATRCQPGGSHFAGCTDAT